MEVIKPCLAALGAVVALYSSKPVQTTPDDHCTVYAVQMVHRGNDVYFTEVDSIQVSSDSVHYGIEQMRKHKNYTYAAVKCKE